MRILRRIVLVVLVLVVVLGAVGVGGVVYLTRRAFPQIDGTINLPGLLSPVTIIRDKYGIPHIYARNAHDLFFAQGYVHAQDRLWQMEIARRGVSGRTSELLVSESSLAADKYVRTVGFRRAAEIDYEAMNDEDKAVVQAYADGVNAFISTHQDSLPIEFTLVGLFGSQGLGYKPEPWTPLDTVQWGKAMAWQQSGDYDIEVLGVGVLAEFGEEEGAAMLAELVPPYDFEGHPQIIPNDVAWERVPTVYAAQDALGSIAGGLDADVGSNSWVLAGERTTTGQALLANDPHIAIQMPAIWYFVSLHCDPVGPECPYEMIGSSLLGLPGVVIGHNARLAWGLTNSSADMTDLYLETITGDQYEFQGRQVDFEVVPEVIKFKGKLPDGYQPSPNEDSTYDAASNTTTITLNVRFTGHGPIISDVDEDTLTSDDYAVAYSWTGIRATEGLVSAVLAIDRSQNWEEFRAATHLAGSPSLTAIYADVDGNIGFQTFGRLPIRAQGDGTLPVPGWTGEYEWTGSIPPDEMPAVYNPPQGYIATANHAIVGPEFPHFITANYDRGYRARRIVDLIESKDKLSPDDFAVIQGDGRNLMAEAIAPYLDDLEVDGDAQKVLDAIRDWKFNQQRDSNGAGAYEVFWLYLLRNTFDDELGDLARNYVSGNDVNGQAVIRLLAQPDSHWWDNVETDKHESRDDILKEALADAARALTAEFGGDPANWKWGNLHTVTFKSQALGSSPVAFIFNRGPFAVDGGQEIVNATGGNFSVAYPDPDAPAALPAKLTAIFGERNSPSLRQIVDLGDLNASRFILTVGQSGLPYHPHYDDMIDLWRNVQYAPMWWERESVEQNAEGTLSLTP